MKEKDKIARMVTVRAASERSGISAYSLRLWLQQGLVAHVWVGKKILVNLDSLEAYLHCAGIADGGKKS